MWVLITQGEEGFHPLSQAAVLTHSEEDGCWIAVAGLCWSCAVLCRGPGSLSWAAWWLQERSGSSVRATQLPCRGAPPFSLFEKSGEVRHWGKLNIWAYDFIIGSFFSFWVWRIKVDIFVYYIFCVKTCSWETFKAASVNFNGERLVVILVSKKNDWMFCFRFVLLSVCFTPWTCFKDLAWHSHSAFGEF